MFDVNFALLTSIFCFLFLLLLGGFDLYPLFFLLIYITGKGLWFI